MVEGLSRAYDVLLELGAHRGRKFLTTWDELKALCDLGDGDRALATMQRYTAVLEEVGLIQVGGIRVGPTWGLLVRLSSGGRPCSSTGEATGIALRLALFRAQMLRSPRGPYPSRWGRGVQ